MRLREPVSVTYRTGLRHAETEIGKWRAETGVRNPPALDRKCEIAGQRLGRTGLTRRNVGGSHTPGNHTAETALPGWACRTRTRKCHFKKCRLKCGANSLRFRNILRPETFRVRAATGEHEAAFDSRPFIYCLLIEVKRSAILRCGNSRVWHFSPVRCDTESRP